MDLSELSELTVNMDLHPAATNTMIMAGEEHLGARLPKDYAQFLKLANGGEGFIGNAYAILWSVEELSSMNRSYEVQKCVPGLLIFGSDGGGEAYGFDTRAPDWPIVQVPFVGMAWNLTRPMGTSFGGDLTANERRNRWFRAAGRALSITFGISA